jgi:hypothetical protein
MHSVLFVASIDQENRDDWHTFSGMINMKLPQTKGIMRLAENVWLLDLTVSIDGFGLLVHQAKVGKIRYGILPFDEEPRWLPDGYNPKPI